MTCRRGSSMRVRESVCNTRVRVATAWLFLATVVASSQADTITVTTDSGGTGGPDCTLRDAMTAANTDTPTGGCQAGSGADTIELPVGAIITLTEVDNDPGGGPSGLPSVNSVVTINGNGTTVQRDDGDGTLQFRILYVAADGNLTLNDLAVTGGGGDWYRDGGGIYNSGTLSLTNSTVSGNTGTNGGGIYNSGTATVIDSTISANKAWAVGWEAEYGDGGGIYNGGTLTVTNSNVSGNIAGFGGGIASDGPAILTNSTVSGNGTSPGYALGWPTHGGGIGSTAQLTLTNSTVSGNMAYGGWPGGSGTGGLWSDGGPATLTNSIVANSAGGPDCAGMVIDHGYNNIEDGSCISDPTSMSGDPNLGPLADNGGPTLTHALLLGSIAIDVGDCAGGTITTDQRGVPRPQGRSCDIGAFERQRTLLNKRYLPDDWR